MSQSFGDHPQASLPSCLLARYGGHEAKESSEFTAKQDYRGRGAETGKGNSHDRCGDATIGTRLTWIARRRCGHEDASKKGEDEFVVSRRRPELKRLRSDQSLAVG